MKTKINLIPKEMRKEGFSPVRVILPVMVLLLLGLLSVPPIMMARKARTLRGEVGELARQRDSLRQQTEGLTQEIGILTEKERMVKKRSADQEKFLSSQIRWSEILREISLLIPEGVWLTTLVSADLKKEDSEALTATQVKLSGFARSHLNVSRFLSRMEGSGVFMESRLLFAQREQAGGRERVAFEMATQLRPQTP